MSLYQFINTPIRIRNVQNTQHHLIIKAPRNYLLMNWQSNFSAEVDTRFFKKCIEEKEFTQENCNVALTKPGKSCLASLFLGKIDTFLQKQECEAKVLGRDNNEVYIISNSEAFIYVGSEHKLQVNCESFESEKILGKGIYNITLLQESQCLFFSPHYEFSLQQHENRMSKKFLQNLNTGMESFLNVTLTLAEVDKLGISRNETIGLNQLVKEIENFKGQHSNKKFAVTSSGISGVITIIIVTIIIAMGCGIKKCLMDKKINRIINKFGEESSNECQQQNE